MEKMADTLGGLVGFSATEFTKEKASFGEIVDAYRGLIDGTAAEDAGCARVGSTIASQTAFGSATPRPRAAVQSAAEIH